MKTRLLRGSCVVLGGLISLAGCQQLFLNEEPRPVASGTTLAGYPLIQDTINASIDKALIAVDNAAARSAEQDSRYTTLRRVLTQARDGNLSTARALSLDDIAAATEKELQEIEALIASDPKLEAEFAALVKDLEDKYAAIPTIEIEAQNFDENGKPIGDPVTISSKNGVIDLGYQSLTSQEFLLIVQSKEQQTDRGFVIDDDWHHWGNGRPWPSGRVDYFFDSSLSSTEQTWMTQAMGRMANGTGMTFSIGENSWWRRLWWGWCLSNYAKIYTESLSVEGQASIGKIGCSFLKMDDDSVTDELWFNHEMGHLFGMIHEHERCDRRHYIRFPAGSNFESYLCRYRTRFYFLWWSWYEYVDNASTEGTPYDYHSIMHYPSKGHNIVAISTGGVWDTHKVENSDGVITQSNNLEWGDENGNTWFTPWDIYTIKRLYGMSPNPKPGYTPAPAFP